MNNHSHPYKQLISVLLLLFFGLSGMPVLHAQNTLPEGALPGLFSVSNGTYVFFSQGNLQYIGSAETPYWKFAEHQWDYFGATSGQNSPNQNVDRDLFGWGTSGWFDGYNDLCYQPWSTEEFDSYYYSFALPNYDLIRQKDWGWNAISNGGNQENIGWRTLTNEEWGYLFDTRGTPSGMRYAKAKVNDVNGVILLPDDWNANNFSLSNTNNASANYLSNVIPAEQWVILEQYGAVFLPAAGNRSGTIVQGDDADGYYWSKSSNGNNGAWHVIFDDLSLNAEYHSSRSYGQSVRLVRIYAYVIGAHTIPADGGTVSGVGVYQAGAECTLTATASAGYTFLNWTENGVIVSNEATYSFVVSERRELVAHFQYNISEGFINGSFSVGPDCRVLFSQGNLQYIGSASTPYWKFAEHQWDYLGETTAQNSASQNVDRDLFGWGTSGYEHGATCYQPWSTSQDENDYCAYGNATYSLSDQTGKADWGCNAILNGGNHENGWRTLTIEEWAYLLTYRDVPSGIRCALAQVDDVNGLILLPDDWNANYYSLNNTNLHALPNGVMDTCFSSNVISATQWTLLEQYGAVFLPAAGYRHGISVEYSGLYGDYWSASTPNSNYLINHIRFGASDLELGQVYMGPYRGLSVRLVRATQGHSFVIGATSSVAEEGVTSGGGVYEVGTECTLTAKANMGYTFANWTENGAVVSTEIAYTFVVSRDRNLIANYEEAISFDDDNAKAICIASWDTNGDGELGISEAAAVTDLGSTFYQQNQITSFNELRYFTGLTSIENNAFQGCVSLASIEIPNSVISIGSFSLPNHLTHIVVEEGNTVYDSRDSCNAIIETSTNTLIVGCKSSVIPNSVTAIGNYAFVSRTGLASIEIPSSVNSIGDYAFGSCTGLTSLTVWAEDPPAMGNNVFGGVDKSIPVYVPCASIETYSNTIGWKEFTNFLPATPCDFSCEINVSVNSDDGGTVTGAGCYVGGETCTLIATANEGWHFVNWLENDEVVSYKPEFNFIVVRDRNLVAIFEEGILINNGDGGTETDQYLPSHSYYKYSLTQQIYTADEIGTAGYFTSIAFFNGGSEKTRNYDIYLVHTDKTIFSGYNDWITVSEEDRVFSGSVTMTAGYWTVIDFDTPFNYDGTHNLALIMDDNTGSFSSGMKCRVFDAPSQAIRIYSDGTNYDPTNTSSYSGTVMSVKNQIVLGIGQPFIINATPNPVDGGTVSGAGAYLATECTLTATPSDGYAFFNWTEDGNVVSTDAEYTFVVLNDRNLVANFVDESSMCGIIFELFGNDDGFGWYGNKLAVSCDNGYYEEVALENGSFSTQTIWIENGSHVMLTWITTEIGEQFINSCSFSIFYSNGNYIYYGDDLDSDFSYEFDLDCEEKPETLFDISIDASPVEGGMVIGADFYPVGTGCLATAIANEGYVFLYWMDEVGQIVSSEPYYYFRVTRDRALTACFMEEDAVCEVTFDLYNSYDGYSGNYLVVDYGYGYGIEQLTVESGSSAHYTRLIPHGSHVELGWIEGDYPEDCSFTISYEGGDTIVEQSNLNSDFSYSFEVDCSGGMPNQTLELSVGWNWVSFNVEITMDDLKAAIVAANPGAAPVIKSKGDGQASYNGAVWVGALRTLDLSQMYEIKVVNACTVNLEGAQVNPTDHPATIKNGANWIAYPLDEEMSVANAFAGFPVTGDNVKSKDGGQATWNGVMWLGALKNLVPGAGYIYNSKATENKTLTF